MTKDVELHSSTWKTMKQALTGLTETASTGFAKRVEELVKISEKVQQLIKEKDTDGAVSYSYYDDTSIGQTLQSKSSTLEQHLERINE